MTIQSRIYNYVTLTAETFISPTFTVNYQTENQINKLVIAPLYFKFQCARLYKYNTVME